ncbi:hypothetical protein C8R43DRAFT_1117151 [Mycena crocata]|nr:hypothetical protein C8R43DRAFT_1117151 [Mycena crocata]
MSIKALVKTYTQEHLSVFKTISEQVRGQVDQTIALIQHDFKFFGRYENGWPIREMIGTYLGNESRRLNRWQREERAWEDAEMDIDSDTDPPRAPTRPAKRKNLAVEEDVSDNPPKVKKTVQSPKCIDEERSCETYFVLEKTPVKAKPAKKEKKTLAKVTVTFEEDEDFPQKIPVKGKVLQLNPRFPQRRRSKAASDADEETPKKLKRKGHSKKTDEDNDDSHDHDQDNNDTEPTIPSLTWDDLPSRCPTVECTDRLPKLPVPRILTMFNRLQCTKKPKNILKASGYYLLQLEICQAITLEKRRIAIQRLGTDRCWPESIDFDDVNFKIRNMSALILNLIRNLYLRVVSGTLFSSQ